MLPVHTISQTVKEFDFLKKKKKSYEVVKSVVNT